MLDKRNKLSFQDELVEPSSLESDRCSNEIENNPTSCITQPNKEKTVDSDITVISSETDSDNVQLLVPGEHTHRRTLSQYRIKLIISQKAVSYYQWFLLLFKNGLWRTTILL